MTNYNPFSLEGKTIFITGASSGIGKAIAIECSKIGAKVIITGRNSVRLNETFMTLTGDGHIQIIADLNNEERLLELIENLPSLDGVVHCAGFVKTMPFQFVNEQALEEIFNINFKIPTTLSAKLIKNKKISRGSSIVFISSICGVYCSSPGNSLYSATKGALNGITKGMALDLASKLIRVNSVNPGMVETEILNDGIITTKQLEEDKGRYPLKRYGQPEEVAYATIYLLSDASSWVTGSSLLIDGGYTLN